MKGSFTKRVLASALLASALLWHPVHAETASEQEVKLALVYKISRFVSWPNEDDRSEFRLCLTSDEVHEIADQRLSGRTVRDNPIRVVKPASPDEARTSCDALYVSGEDEDANAAYIEALAGSPVLTLGDAPNFAQSGGMVGLTTRKNRVGMDINVKAYEQCGLSVNSQLLQLAKIVKTKKGDRR